MVFLPGRRSTLETIVDLPQMISQIHSASPSDGKRCEVVQKIIQIYNIVIIYHDFPSVVLPHRISNTSPTNPSKPRSDSEKVIPSKRPYIYIYIYMYIYIYRER